jgi:hypothetical protein
MMTALIVGIAGLALTLVLFLVRSDIYKRRREEQEKQRRIEYVVNRYMDLRENGKTAGLDGLQKAGVGRLQIMEAVSLIIGHGENDPLQRETVPMHQVPLKVFFELAAQEHVNLLRGDEVRKLIYRATGG